MLIIVGLLISKKRMKSLCVYCASGDRIAPAYAEVAREVGTTLAACGWMLVYGGGRTGLMGALARAAKAGGARVEGIIPTFMMGRELEFVEADEMVQVTTMRERKALMQEKADAFLALPGGWGTLEELLETVTLTHLEVLRKPVVILNQDGYYDDLLRMFQRTVDERFMHDTIYRQYVVAATVVEAFAALENWRTSAADKPWFQTR